MLVRINGKETEIPDSLSIKDLIQSKKLSASTLIIELNGEIVRREKWDSLKLNPDDNIELVRLIGGG